MNLRHQLHWLALWTSATLGLNQVTSAQPVTLNHEGELLVKWKQGPLSVTAAHGNVRCGGLVKGNFSHCGWQWVQLPPGISLSEGMRRYRGEPEVLAVEPNIVGHLDGRPNDPQFGSQWNLEQISAPAAWDITTGSAASRIT